MVFSISISALMLSKWRGVPIDWPNERSLHDRPVPRIGGISVLSSILIVAPLIDFQISALLPVVTFLALISLIDDYRSLPVTYRLAAHLLSATIFVLFDRMEGGFWFHFVSIVGLIWAINLYNFMDGSDGLATGMAVIGFGTYGVTALMAGNKSFALFSLSVSGAAAGFLVFNWAPAKAFLGDSGSISLGFLAGAIGVAGARRNLWGWEFPPMVFFPFVVDASVTLFRRMFRGEIPWRAHRSHYYQRLIQMGWDHKTLALWAYAFMCVSSAVAVALTKLPPRAQPVLLLGAVLSGLVVAWRIDVRWNLFVSRGLVREWN